MLHAAAAHPVHPSWVGGEITVCRAQEQELSYRARGTVGAQLGVGGRDLVPSR